MCFAVGFACGFVVAVPVTVLVAVWLGSTLDDGVR